MTRTVATLVLAVTVGVGAGCIPAQPGDISAAGLAHLRGCESHGDYGAVSASGTYRGAYQFDRRTWDSVASRYWPPAVGTDPADAPWWLQDHLARRLWAERGSQPWPICGRRV